MLLGDGLCFRQESPRDIKHGGCGQATELCLPVYQGPALSLCSALLSCLQGQLHSQVSEGGFRLRGAAWGPAGSPEPLHARCKARLCVPRAVSP